MKLYDIISNLKFIGIKNYKDIEIDSLSCRCQEKCSNSLFFCVNGTKVDGHNYAEQAIENGAVCLVVERFLDIKIIQILVDDVRKAMSYISSVFFKTYASKMKFVGITGTNGKTTTTFILREILMSLGHSVGLIGTEGTYINNLMLPPTLTTPDPIDLHKLIADMDNNGCEYCVMEVSAHAIALNKIDNIYYDVVGLTNITKDHLDFFINMENYIKCKTSLFSFSHAKCGVANVDCKFKDLKQSSFDLITYGEAGEINLLTDTTDLNGTDFKFIIGDKVFSAHTNLLGKYNISNLLLAIGVLYKLDFDVQQVVDTIEKIKFQVPGRFNFLDVKANFNVVVDYAHTPDGIKNILTTISALPINHLITVFGCGGNRDKTKRNEMGKIATQLSDYVVVTSDNPRDENPNLIINQIIEGLNPQKFTAIENRKTAIEYALSIAKKGDVVAVLGKGAENYQEIKGVKLYFSDYAVVDDYFAKHNKNLAQKG